MVLLQEKTVSCIPLLLMTNNELINYCCVANYQLRKLLKICISNPNIVLYILPQLTIFKLLNRLLMH